MRAPSGPVVLPSAKLALIAAVLLGFAGAWASAQESSASRAELIQDEYNIRAWSVAEGLPMRTGRSIEQSPDGYVWIGTFQGIARLDGRRVTVFSSTNTPGIERSHFISQAFDQQGRHWFGTEEGVVWRKGDRWHTWGTAQGWPESGYVNRIEISATGEPVFACGGKLLAMRGSDLVTIPAPPRPDNDKSALRPVVSLDGTLWCESDTQVCRWNGNEWTVVASGGNTTNPFGGLCRSNAGGVWITQGPRAWRISDGVEVESRAVPEEFEADRRCALEDSRGDLWFGFLHRGLAVVRRDGSYFTANQATGLPDTEISNLFEDREGNVYAGTGASGAIVFTRKQIRMLGGKDQESGRNAIVSITPDGFGGVLVLNSLGLLQRYSLDGDAHPAPPVPPSSQVLAILRDPNGAIFAGTKYDGLLRLPLNQPWQWLQPKGSRPKMIRALYRDTRGRIWFGHEGGFGIADGTDGSLVELSSPITERVVCFAEDARGWMWIGTTSRVVAVEMGGFSILEEIPVPRSVTAMRRAADADLWVATEDGSLLRARGKTLARFGPEQGLQTGEVSGVLEDGYGDLWCASTTGIYWLRRKNLEAVANGTEPEVLPVPFDSCHGLPFSYCYSNAQPSAKSLDAGKFLFATRRGVALIDQRRMASPRFAANPILESVVADGKEVRISHGASEIFLPAGTKHVQMRFSVPTMLCPDRVKADLYDESKPTDKRPIDASGMVSVEPEPGRELRLLVRARGADPNAGTGELRFRLSVIPQWWQSTAFRIGIPTALAIVVALSGILLQERRVRSSRAQMERERALSEERARFAAVLESTHELVAFADEQGRLFYLNPMGRELLQIGATEPLEPLHIESLLDTRSLSIWKGEVLARWRPNAPWIGKLWFYSASGAQVPIAAAVLGHRRPDESVDFISIVGHDMRPEIEASTRQTRLEAQLQHAQKLEAIGTLAGGIAHDFNNILASILGSAELARLKADEKTLTHLQQIIQASLIARDLVRRILEFSRSDAAHHEVVDLAKVARDAVALLKPTLPGGLDIQLESTQPARVLGDASQLHQVLVNLCLNAAQAIPTESGWIRIEIRREPEATQGESAGWVVLRVSDSGVGMDEQVRSRIFEPFFTTKAVGKGTGLGLAVVHGIVRRHGGTTAVDSAVGQGTTFTIRFPEVTRAISESEHPPALPSPEISAESGRVLVVDDEPLVGRTFAEMLGTAGFDSTYVKDPQNALAMVRQNPRSFDAIVTDLGMPGMSGIDLTREIHRTRPEIPVILITGYGAGSLERRDLTAVGRLRVLEKPIDMQSLIAVVRNEIGTARQALRS